MTSPLQNADDLARPPYRIALADSGAMQALAPFDPHVAGTLPLGIAVPVSDIDILCCFADRGVFIAALENAFASKPDFVLRHRPDLDAVLCRFTHGGWPFEIFGQPRPVAEQHGWRHYRIEEKLLTLGGAPMRDAILTQRGQGLKTEAAFCAVLGLSGDPYVALLTLEADDDARLLKRLRDAGIIGGRE